MNTKNERGGGGEVKKKSGSAKTILGGGATSMRARKRGTKATPTRAMTSIGET